MVEKSVPGSYISSERTTYLAAMSYDTISDFLQPVDRRFISEDEGYKDGQLGNAIEVNEEELPNIDEADIVFVGCNEQRGGGQIKESGAADAIRKELYNLYFWHTDVMLADVGNVRMGKTLGDTYAALKVVIHELMEAGKLVVVLGGSNDLTLAQYYAFAENKTSVDVVGIDAIIDINMDSPFRSDSYLMEMITAEPNYMRHYSHLAFQSYYTHPRMLETMDKLRFDPFRVGHIKEHMEDMEPVLRNGHLLSFDISAIANAFAPANTVTPNGLTGEEACILMQYAGMSTQMRNIGIYGYKPDNDRDALTAKQISQMLWYLIDGKSRGKRETSVTDRSGFNEFYTAFGEVNTVFLQSKKTGRWWMQLPDEQFIACTHKDYLQASINEIPERWLRVHERP